LTLNEFIIHAINEDVGSGDHTSLACIPADAQSKAVLKVKADGILAGVEEALEVFRLIDENLQTEIYLKDGSIVKQGNTAFTLSGSSQSILKAERLALNIMQRMSGIATLTHKYVKAVEGFRAKILDTRKTTPNFRYFEKKAVRLGGGENHRFALYDMLMIKDNHISYAGGIEQAILRANDYLKAKSLDLKIEIEAGNLNQVAEILKVGKVHRIMLDNFPPEKLQQAVNIIAGRFETESSGGITEANLRAHALTGVDYISVGALTHHIRSLDLSLKAVH